MEELGANGFGVDKDDVEEKGFCRVLEDGDDVPNMLSPRFCDGCGGVGASCFAFFSSLPTLSFPDLDECILVPLAAFTLPAFLRQVLFLHAKTYSLLSWSGNFSGRSQFSCSSRHIKPLQVLHFARSEEGESAGSGHV